jgi:GTPase SAR1 family protein
MKEIAGHKRNDWTTYLEDVHGLIYMFDMSLESHKEEMKALQEVLFYEENGTRVLAGVPVLLVLNKSQLFVRSTPSDSDASNKIVRALTEDYLACFQKEGSDAVANPFQIIWTDSITGGGIDVDRLDWFVETISIRQNPGMLGAIRSVIG